MSIDYDIIEVDNAMEVENIDEIEEVLHFINQAAEEIHPLALVINVDNNLQNNPNERVFPLVPPPPELNTPPELNNGDQQNIYNLQTVNPINPNGVVLVPQELQLNNGDHNIYNIQNNPNNVEFPLMPQNEAEGNSPTGSIRSSRVPSPQILAEDSNQSSDVNLNEPQQSSSKRTYNEDDDKEDGSICPICLDEWTNTGPHRICSLKCGHLFGYQCITRWLQQLPKKKSCPTCKKKVAINDIRYIYAKKLTAIDTAELDDIKKQLDVVTEQRNKIATQLATSAYREKLLNQEIAQLKAELYSFKRQAVNVPTLNQPLPIERVKLYMDKAMEVCKFGGSRVFDARCELNLLMASMKSPTNLFNGYGLKKINISDYRTLGFIPIHNSHIRDICFHKDNNWVLTASMDKTFKVVNNHDNTVIYQFTHQMPLWSCCWDENNPFGLYVGTQSGSVIKYDTRQLNEAVNTFSIEGDMSPVVSVASIASSPGETLAQGGVVSCKLNSLWLYENVDGEQTRHPLSLEGPFVSMKYQANTKQLLVSSRPNSRITYARHTLCTFEKNEQDNINCNILHTFQGGCMQKLLSKSCFLSHTSDYVAAHEESCKSVFIWSINTGQKVCSVTAHESVLDLKGLQNQNGSFLVSLTDKKLEFFKFA